MFSPYYVYLFHVFLKEKNYMIIKSTKKMHKSKAIGNAAYFLFLHYYKRVYIYSVTYV